MYRSESFCCIIIDLSLDSSQDSNEPLVSIKDGEFREHFINTSTIELISFSGLELQYFICVLRSMNWLKQDSWHHRLQQKGLDSMICLARK
jgi:hypothetical protein